MSIHIVDASIMCHGSAIDHHHPRSSSLPPSFSEPDLKDVSKRSPADGKVDIDAASVSSQPYIKRKTCAEMTVEEDAANRSITASSPYTESETPPYLLWSESLRSLLDDGEGVELFRHYLEQEGCVDSLDFWLACNGLKKRKGDECHKVARIIHRRYLRQPSVALCVSRVTRQGVSEKIHSWTSGCGDEDLLKAFNVAQAEVESSMSRTTYKNFLQSDFYLGFMQKQQQAALDLSHGGRNGSRESPDVSESGSSCGRPSAGPLPTVDENEELNTETFVNCSVWPGSGLTNVVPAPQLQIAAVVTAQALSLSHNYPRMSKRRNPRKGEPYVGIHPPSTHLPAMYAPYLPVSAQDSELQSLSSGAHTDDTMSLTDSSIDGFSIHSKKHHKAIISQRASQNREKELCQRASQNREKELCQRRIVPKGQEQSEEYIAKFANILTKRLEHYLHTLQSGEEVNKKIQEVEVKESSSTMGQRGSSVEGPTSVSLHHPFSSLPPGLLKLSMTEEGDQSILDEHVNRVWNDTTEDRPSPGWGSPMPQGNRSRHRRDQPNLSSDMGTARDYGPRDGGIKYYPGYIGGPGVKTKLQMGHHSQRFNQPPEFLDLASRPDEAGDRAVVSGRSHIDSGVGDTIGSSSLLASVNSQDRVSDWVFNNEYTCSYPAAVKDTAVRHRKAAHSSTSNMPSVSSHGRVKKPLVYNSLRSGSLERGGVGVGWAQSVQPKQPLAQDPSMPMLPPPDPGTQLEETRRRLENETVNRLSRSKSGLPSKDKSLHLEVQKSRTLPCKASSNSTMTPGIVYNCEVQSPIHDVYPPTSSFAGSTSKKQSRRSGGSLSNAPPAPTASGSTAIGGGATASDECTVIGIYYVDEEVPYRFKFYGKNVTLRQFKTLLTRRGKFRYFFKNASNEFGTGVINEEITDDNAVLPLWEGKVFAQLHPID